MVLAVAVLFAASALVWATAVQAQTPAADEPHGGTTTQDVVEVLREVPATGNDLRNAQAQNSPQLAVDPTDPDVVALANRQDKPDFSCALQLSGDGGRSWAPVDPVSDLPDGADKCYGPEVAFDGQGRLYYLFVGLEGAGNRPSGVYLTTTTDRGRTFTEPLEVLGPGNYQVRMALDRTAGETGRLHLVWLRTFEEPGLGGLPAPPNPIVASHSDDGGQSWSEPVRVSDPDRHLRAVAPSVAVGADGALHVAYYDLQDDSRDYRGLEGDEWPGTWSVVHRVSEDRGVTFTEPAVEVDDQVHPPGRVMLIFTMPPPAIAADSTGHVHVAWHDARNGDWDVFAAASGDGGHSWTEPVRVNDDDLGNGKHQLLPQLAVAPDGRVEAVFFDRRHHEPNLYQHVYYAASTNRGESFGPNVRLTRFHGTSQNGARYAVPSARGLYDLGTRLGLVVGPSGVLAAWPDTRHPQPGTGAQDVFTTTVVRDAGDRSDWWTSWPSVVALLTVITLAVAVLARRRLRAQSVSPVARESGEESP